MKFRVTTHSEMIVEAESKEEAIEYYYNHTDGTELEAVAKQIKSRTKKVQKR